ncbi:MAG: helix-turn-helix transcriptional regulator [Rhizomicrobium sp.]
MTKNKNKPPGLSGALQAFDEDLAVDVPGYAKALAAEREAEASVDAQCKAIRAMFRRKREAKGLTQGDLAARMGVMQPAINKIENGDGDIGIKTLLRYAAALEGELSVGFSEPDAPSQHPRPAAPAHAVGWAKYRTVRPQLIECVLLSVDGVPAARIARETGLPHRTVVSTLQEAVAKLQSSAGNAASGSAHNRVAKELKKQVAAQIDHYLAELK